MISAWMSHTFVIALLPTSPCRAVGPAIRMYYELGFGESLAGTSDGCSRSSFRTHGTSHKRRFGLRNHLNDCFHCYGWDDGIWDTKGTKMKRRGALFHFWHDRIHLLCRKSKHIDQLPIGFANWLRTKYANLEGPLGSRIWHYLTDVILRSKATQQRCPTMRDRIQSWSISPWEKTLPITLPVGLGCRSLT